MDKVLSRKMFRQKYLKQQTPQGFQKGGIADPQLTISDEEVEKKLGLENTQPKEEPTATTPEPKSVPDAIGNLFSLDDTSGGLTRNEKMITLLAPIAAALLTGEQKAGEDKGPGTLRALGLGLAQLPASIMAIKESDLAARTKSDELNTKEGVMSIAKALEMGLLTSDQVDPLDKGSVGYTQSPDGTISLSEEPKISESFRKDILPVASKDLYKPETVQFGVQLAKVEKLVKKYLDQGIGIPGIGLNSTYESTFTDEGKEMVGAIQELKNRLIKEMSGAAVTESEYERLKIAFNEGFFATDQNLIDALVRMRSTYDGALNVYAGKYGDQKITNRLLETHRQNTGFGSKLLGKAATFKDVESGKNFKIVNGKLVQIED